jgi:hypothetical protein
VAILSNLVLFIGGLGDGLLTIPYMTRLARSLPEGWSLVQVLLSSSYSGWGVGSIKRDARELAQCVAYFHQGVHGNIVLMGHSTGCQDIMEYLVGGSNYPAIDGAILQAPVSDREALSLEFPSDDIQRSVSIARDMMAAKKGEDIMPRSKAVDYFGAPVCARRWLSLVSPDHDGEDDYFSSDLSDAQLSGSFGRLPSQTKLCILYSGKDQFVPESVDKLALVTRWMTFINSGGGRIDGVHSGVIANATHDLKSDSEEIKQDLINRVNSFLNDLNS